MNCATIYSNQKTSLLKAILQGLDRDLGLFVPTTFYKFIEEDYQKMQDMLFAERLAYILQFFFDGELDFATLKADCLQAMQTFAVEDVLPVVKIDKNLFIAELLYGQTHSFYDFANALFPLIYRHAYEKYGENKKSIVFAATDVNSASAIATAMKACQEIQTILLYPAAFCSKLQMREIASKHGENIEILPIEAADLEDVEELLLQFLKENRTKLEEKGYCVTILGEWNILNILVQIAIFVSSYLDILSAKEIGKTQNIDILLPIEHYSNFTAVLYAKQMGISIQNIIVGMNINSTFYQALQKGYFTRQDSNLTIAPAMDSNAPYALFRALALFDTLPLKEQMQAFLQKKSFAISPAQKQGLTKNIFYVSAKEDEQINSIFNFFEEYSYLLDTHTACAENAYQTLLDNRVLANSNRLLFTTVHPFKYPQDTMYAVTGEDINDTFKAMKHLEMATAMQAPKSFKKLRTLQIKLQEVSIQNCKLFLQNLVDIGL